MLKIASFKADNYKEANDFIEAHGANAKGGVSINNEMIYVMYNDGVMSKGYATNLLNGELADQKSQRIIALEDVSYWGKEKEIAESLKPVFPEGEFKSMPTGKGKKLDEETEKLNNENNELRKAREIWAKENDQYEAVMSNINQSVLLAANNLTQIEKKIASLELHIGKVESGEITL